MWYIKKNNLKSCFKTYLRNVILIIKLNRQTILGPIVATTLTILHRDILWIYFQHKKCVSHLSQTCASTSILIVYPLPCQTRTYKPSRLSICGIQAVTRWCPSLVPPPAPTSHPNYHKHGNIFVLHAPAAAAAMRSLPAPGQVERRRNQTKQVLTFNYPFCIVGSI